MQARELDHEQQEFYEQVSERLGSTELDPELLEQSSRLIARSYGKGIKWDDIFPFGIKRPDGVTVRGRIPIRDFGKVQDLFSDSLLRKLELFPRGIKAPDFLEVNAHFSRQGMHGGLY